ncbi:MAG: hypothetical protein HZA54_12175 [Planctomycetes bacterium]|nr:hypothetical protein [Planctomycetota bacterium]
MPEATSAGGRVPGRRTAVALVAGVVLSTLAAGVAGERLRAETGVPLDLEAATRASAVLPWLCGYLGRGAVLLESSGAAGAAVQACDGVLAVLPGHPGTALTRARARLAEHGVHAGGGRRSLPPAVAAAIRSDLDTAEAGYRQQLRLVREGEPGAPHSGAIGETRAPATEGALAEIESLRERF